MRTFERSRWIGVVATLSTLMVAAWATGSDASFRDDREGLPLEPAGTLEFTTNEGTWISLDVSPDGEWVFFELLGDIYKVSIDGGDAARVTEGMGYDSQPVVSPDGQWLAFVSDRAGADNLWISRLDGSDARKLSSGRQNGFVSPAWTPDGRYVIVTRTGRDGGLRMFHVDGGSGIALDGDADEEGPGGPGGPGGAPARVGAVMDPEGRYLYFAESVSSPGSRGQFPMWQIGRRDMVSGEVDRITQNELSAFRPELSPDGRLLVYATRHETQTGLRVRDLETGADRWLIWPVQRDEQESGGAPSRDTFPGYSFTPDGEEVVVTFDGKIHRVDVDTGDTTPVPFEARVALDVGPDLTAPYRVPQGPVRARLVQSPAASPDGARVAFSVLTKIYVAELLGDDTVGEPRRLTASADWEFKPAWSPDGEWIAYVTWGADGGHIWRARADGSGQPQRLTPYPAFYTDITFSPDGSRIVGLRGNPYQRHRTFSEFGGLRVPLDLVWLPAEGGDVELVVPARGLGAPHFTEDPDRIYVYSDEGLMSLRYDGTDRRVHLKVTGPRNPRSPRPPAAETVLMRPDGRWALAKVVNQLWVVAVPQVGGEPPTVNVRSPALPAERITDIGADYFGWADGGDTVTWTIGSTFYRRPFDSIDFAPDEEENQAEEEEGGAEGESQHSGEGGDEEGPEGDGGGEAEGDAGGQEAGEQEEQEEKSAEKDRQDEEPEFLDRADPVEAYEIVMEFPRAVPEGTIVLRGANVITMAGDPPGSEVVEDADLVVTGNRIAAVGRRGTVEVPAGAHEVDVSGTWIVPGFVDTHAHWEFRTHDVLEPHNWSLVANLAYGVTAGLDVQTSTNDYFAYQDLVETGQSVGQRAFMTGPGIFSTNDFRSYEATLAYLQRYVHHYRTPNIKSYMVGNREQRQWVVKAAAELGLMPTTEGGRDMKLDITHAIDGFHGNEHTLPVIPLFRDVVELYARTRTAYTPTLLVQYGGPSAREYFFSRTEVHDDDKLARFTPHNRLDEMTRRRSFWARDDEFVFAEAATQAARIQRAGGLVGVGGHGELQGLGYHWEMWAHEAGEMTPREVLQAATIDGARIIGVEADLGSLEAGKLADLVVLERDPLEDVRATTDIRWVMKNGELYDDDTLRKVWPEGQELPPFWWWDAGPEPAGEDD